MPRLSNLPSAARTRQPPCWAMILSLAGPVVLVPPGGALAQGDPVAEARAHYEAGVAALGRDDGDSAVRELEASYRLRRSHVVGANLARAYQLLGRLVDARSALVQAISEGQGRWNAEQLARLRDDLARVEAQLGHVRLRLLDPSARVLVDGHETEVVGEELWMTPGSHRLAVRRAGYLPASRTIEVRAGQGELWAVEQQPEPSLSAPRRGVPGWVIPVALTGGAAVVTAIVLGAVFGAPRAQFVDPPGSWQRAVAP